MQEKAIQKKVLGIWKIKAKCFVSLKKFMSKNIKTNF